METKKCICCKEEKPKTADYFFHRNKAKGWLSSWCKQCRAEKRQISKPMENEAQRKRRGGKPCVSCGTTNRPRRVDGLCGKCAKPDSSFQLQAQSVRGVCRVCGCENIGDLPNQKYCGDCLSRKRARQKKADKCIYKSRLRKCTPLWADKSKIKEIYKLKPDGCHVDHIIPIRGDNVCGLHCEENLQYLTADENIKKSNHYSLEHEGRR